MSVSENLIKSVLNNQKHSERSKQKAIGPSEIGGCRRRLWYKMHNQPKTNDNILRLPAFMGTAIHSMIEEELRKLDVYADTFEVEIEVTDGQLTGHVDLYIPDRGEIIDWKTTKVKSLSHFPSKQQKWQVHLYGYLLSLSGREVKTVTLVGIPRDSDERDIKIYSEPYDKYVAQDALDWLTEVEKFETPPAPEKDAFFCKHYCGFYDATGKVGCTGKLKKQLAQGHEIDDPAYIAAAKDYAEMLATLIVEKENEDGLGKT